MTVWWRADEAPPPQREAPDLLETTNGVHAELLMQAGTDRDLWCSLQDPLIDSILHPTSCNRNIFTLTENMQHMWPSIKHWRFFFEAVTEQTDFRASEQLRFLLFYSWKRLEMHEFTFISIHTQSHRSPANILSEVYLRLAGKEHLLHPKDNYLFLH